MSRTEFSKIYEQTRREYFIDRELFWQGQITRKAIMDAFGVSVDTAKDDLRNYRDKYSPDLTQNPQTQIFEAPLGFTQRCSLKSDPEEYLSWLAGGPIFALPVPDDAARKNWTGQIDVVPTLERRKIDSTCLQGVLRAIRSEKEIEIAYKSPHDREAKCFWVYPHALLSDSFRWSCRCWRYDHERWGEIVLDRIEDVFDSDGKNDLRRPADKDKIGKDADWHEYVDVELAPHPGLSPDTKQSIEDQYGMRDGVLLMPIRKALLIYFLKRYQLEEPETKSQKAPHQQPLIVKNRPAVTAAIPPHMRIPPVA